MPGRRLWGQGKTRTIRPPRPAPACPASSTPCPWPRASCLSTAPRPSPPTRAHGGGLAPGAAALDGVAVDCGRGRASREAGVRELGFAPGARSGGGPGAARRVGHRSTRGGDGVQLRQAHLGDLPRHQRHARLAAAAVVAGAPRHAGVRRRCAGQQPRTPRPAPRRRVPGTWFFCSVEHSKLYLIVTQELGLLV